MKKSVMRMLAFVMTTIIMSASVAMADLQRGDDSYDEVYDLQQLLFEAGWLFDQPDGIFGGDTEAAVMGFEEYAGLPVDGIADDEMIYELAVSLEKLNEECGIISGYFGEDIVGYFIGCYDEEEADGYVEENGASAVINTEEQEPIVLNASVIIDGNTIYYAGELDGEGEGVYAMNADGSELRKISDICASLKAVFNGNLLVWNHYDAMLEVLKPDGTLEAVFDRNCHTIAADGRFYFGGSYVTDDGYDHQWILSSDPEYHDWYYPVDVEDGYLYFIDANNISEYMYYESAGLPFGDVTLNRLDLESGDISVLSGPGTNYIGIEDGKLYYTREDFDIYDEVSGGTFTIEVDEGLYFMDLETLAETRITELSDDLLIFEYYMLVQDGVVYGEYYNYNYDEPVCNIIRTQVNGDVLPALEMGMNDTTCQCVTGGVFYGTQGVFIEEGEDYRFAEYIVACDMTSGEFNAYAMDENDALSYTEARPRIAAANNRIYFCVQDQTNGAESLKSMAPDGSDIKTLAQSVPYWY